MRRETAVHFVKTPDGDVLVDESGGRLQMGDAGSSPVGGGLNWRGPWEDGETYTQYDVVNNRKGLYVCIETEAAGEPGAPGVGESLGDSWTSSQTNPDPEAHYITVGTSELVVADGGDSFTWKTGDARPTAIGVIETETKPFAFVGTLTPTVPAGLEVSMYAQATPFGSTGLQSQGSPLTSGAPVDLDDAGGYGRLVFVANGTSGSNYGTVTLEIEKTSGEDPINVPDASTSWDLMVKGV